MTLALPERLPPSLAALASEHYERLAEALEAEGERAALERAARDPAFAELLIGSDFAVDWLVRHPPALAELLESDRDRRSPGREGLARALEADLAAEAPGLDSEDAKRREAALGRALRRLRNRELVGIIWRDLGGRAGLDATVADVTALAELTIAAALERLHAWAEASGDIPRGPDGAPVRMAVLGLGKLGGAELNLSSDVDLIFTCPNGDGGAGRTPLEHLLPIARRLIALLGERTGEGFVFRVDLRLRPFGESGPLVQPAAAMIGYYEEQGRDWERYALIKARPVAGDLEAGAALLEELKPFVYRRYLDFGAIDALRRMKALIRGEVRRAGTEDDVKLGDGGIREVEFVAQVFQLIHGGRDVRLQRRGLREVLARLAETGAIAGKAAAELDAAYVFLRRVEHRLQAVRDRQTQRLPREDGDRARLAWSLGFADWAGFAEALATHRAVVSAHFSATIAGPDPAEADDDAALAPWRRLWEEAEDAETGPRLAEAGFAEPEAARERLADLRRRRQEVGQDIGRERLDAVVPRLLRAAAAMERPDAAFARALPVIEAVLRRTAYLVLLVENPQALEQLLRLTGGSSLISRTLAHHPILLDELLDPRTLYTEPDRDALERELTDALRAVDPEDLEQQMEALRYFKEAVELRTAACEVGGVLPLMRVSDALTWLAEVVLARVTQLAWEQMVSRHGPPTAGDGEPQILVVGYGKLGGIELGWGSDLDLVFLHDASLDGETAGGEGRRSVSNAQFFNRLGQRIIHLLATRTLTGSLYEVDVRLRPSGRSGVLVSTLDSFAAYQGEQAWTWEHQALVRARPVAGSAALAERFEQLRAEALCRPRDREALRGDVAGMRARMLAELRGLRQRPDAGALEDRTELELKQDPGGVVDIEFMVQYLVLGWAHERPELVRHTDNIRILETARQAGILDPSEAELLIDAYKAFRAEIHRKALDDLPARSRAPELIARAARVAELWERRLGP